MAIDHINIEAKTDRELLIMAVSNLNSLSQKVDDLDEKVDAACGMVNDNKEEIEALNIRVAVVEDRVNLQLKVVLATVITVITSIVGLIIAAVKRVI